MLLVRLTLALVLAGIQPTFKTGVDLTTFGVTVTDRKGGSLMYFLIFLVAWYVFSKAIKRRLERSTHVDRNRHDE